MIAWIALSLLTPLGIGFFALSLLWQKDERLHRAMLLKVCLGSGLGLGIVSLLFFLWLLVAGAPGRGVVLIEMVLLAGLIAAFVIRQRGDTDDSRVRREPSCAIPALWLIRLSFYFVLACALVSFIFLTLRTPHGGWDAWAIWNLRARFLFLSGTFWKNAFSQVLNWSHPDYPLLLPGAIARCWTLSGNNSLVIPAVIANLYTVATAGLLYCSLAIVRSRNHALLAGLVLVGTPLFIFYGSSQYADVPLSFFILATISLFYIRDTMCRGFHVVCLAGMMAGCAAWTKDEGLLFLIATICARFAVTTPTYGWKAFGRELLAFASGLAPLAVMIAYFKTTLAPPPDLLTAHEPRTALAYMTDFSRYGLIIKESFKQIFFLGKAAIPLVPTLMIAALIAGTQIRQDDKKAVLGAALTCCAMLVGFFFVYVCTPHGLKWHLTSSLSRLLMQLWPSFVFIFFLLFFIPRNTTTQEAPLCQTR